MKSWSVTIQMKAAEQYFPVMLFIMAYKLAKRFSLWIKSSHSSESYWIVLSCAPAYYAVDGGSNFASLDGTSSATNQIKATAV